MGWVTVGNGTINKSTKDTGAPYYGKCTLTLGGVEYQLSLGCWVKDGQNGSKFFSVKYSMQEDDSPRPPQKQATADEVPF